MFDVITTTAFRRKWGGGVSPFISHLRLSLSRAFKPLFKLIGTADFKSYYWESKVKSKLKEVSVSVVIW